MDNFSSILQDTAQNNIKQTLAAIADVILTNPNENLSTKLEKQEKAKSLAKQHLANSTKMYFEKSFWHLLRMLFSLLP